jgi:large subunit ribosomal protein L24
MEKIRKGDQVVVTSGETKESKAPVLQVMANSTVMVEGINLVKKHQKGNPMTGAAGGINTKRCRSNVLISLFTTLRLRRVIVLV